MTSSEHSDKEKGNPRPYKSPFLTEGDQCPQCGGPLVWKNAYPFPVVLQTVFGVSFVAYLLLLDRVKENRPLVWAWAAFQIITGVLLVRRRLMTKKRVLHCIRCTAPLR